MKLSDWGVGQWLSAVVLVLLAVLATLAYRGLGGWSAPLDADALPSAEQTAAPIEVPPVSGVAPESIYRMSLFSVTRSEDSAYVRADTASAGASGVDVQGLTLISVLITPHLTMAIFQTTEQKPLRVRLGEAVPGTSWLFTRAEPRLAVLSGPGGELQMLLRTVSRSGAPPTGTISSPPMLTPPIPVPAPVSTAVPSAPSPEAEIRQRLSERRAQLKAETPTNHDLP